MNLSLSSPNFGLSIFRHTIHRLCHFLIGDLAKISFSPEEMRSNFEHHSLGLFGHRILWQPASREDLQLFLATVDPQPGSRAPYQSAELLIRGSSFIVADTTPTALVHRRELLERLSSPDRFAELMWTKLEEDPLSSPMQVVAEELLGIQLSRAECDRMIHLGELFKFYSGLGIHPGLLWILPQFRKERSVYQNFIEKILEREIQKIKETKSGSGLIAQKALQKLQQNPHCTSLHKDPNLKSLVLTLIAVDNVIATQQNVDGISRKELENLFEDIRRLGAIHGGALNFSLIKTMPLLEELYQRCLTETFPQIIMSRYVAKGIQCGDRTIPPRSYVLIKNPPDKATFSTGRRICPGRFIAEALLKTRLVYLAMLTTASKMTRVPRMHEIDLPEDEPLPPYTPETSCVDLKRD